VIWAITIYMLAYTVTMPLAGKIADLYGRKRLYIAGVGLFSIGSLACGLAWDINSLIAFRVVQAIGAGMILPAALSEVSSAVPEKSRGMAMGIMMAINAVAAIIGPNLGGFLVEHFGWRYVFYINPPIGILAIVLALKFTETYGTEKHSIDFVGAGLLGGGLLAFMFGVIRLGDHPLTDITVGPLFILALVLGIALVLWERRVREPIISVPLLARGDILALNLAALAFGVCFFTVVLYIPSYAQTIFSLGVQDSGSILTPLTVSVLVMAILGGKLMDRYGMKPVMLIGAIIMCVGLFALVFLVEDTTSLAIVLLFMGIGVGFCMGSFQTLIISMVPAKLKGSGTGVVNVFMNMGGILGPTISSFFMADAGKKIADAAAEAMAKALATAGGMPAGAGMSPASGMPASVNMSAGNPDMQAIMAMAVKDAMTTAFHNIYLLAAFFSIATVLLIGYILVRERYLKKESPPEIRA
jgi:EmrB/QacA subfamily drug resistance transporter